MMGAAFFKTPSAAITEDEARNLAAAVVRVTELYDVPLMSEQARAWLNLGMVGCGIYGTRIAAAMLEAKKERDAKQAAKAAAAAAQQPGPMAIDQYQGARIVN